MNDELPPLPEAAHGYYAQPMYSTDQMREYGRACERAAYERAIKAVEDAGGDNAYYHADAIRALGADK